MPDFKGSETMTEHYQIRADDPHIVNCSYVIRKLNRQLLFNNFMGVIFPWTVSLYRLTANLVIFMFK
jgi:hypothetical protein